MLHLEHIKGYKILTCFDQICCSVSSDPDNTFTLYSKMSFIFKYETSSPPLRNHVTFNDVLHLKMNDVLEYNPLYVQSNFTCNPGATLFMTVAKFNLRRRSPRSGRCFWSWPRTASWTCCWTLQAPWDQYRKTFFRCNIFRLSGFVGTHHPAVPGSKSSAHHLLFFH